MYKGLEDLGLEPLSAQVLSQRCNVGAPLLEKNPMESAIPPMLLLGSAHNNCASTFGKRVGPTPAGSPSLLGLVVASFLSAAGHPPCY